jgi:putative PEP-CTERM system TPR-repeat lipoprotein
VAIKLKHLSTLAMALGLAACAPSPDELMTRAESALKSGDARSAEIDLKSLLQREPENAKARAMLGEAYTLSGNFGAAEIELEKAKELGAPADLIQVSSCRVLVAKGSFEDALKACSSDAATGEKKVQLQLVTGGALMALERPADARKVYQAVLQAQPTNIDALLGVAGSFQAEGDIGGATAVLDGAHDDFKNEARYWFAHGGLNAAAGKLPAAEADYKRASEKAKGPPDSNERVMSLGALSEAQARQGKFAEAEENTAKLVKLAPQNPLIRQLRAQVAAASGKLEEARTLLEELVVDQPQNYQAVTMLALVQIQQGNLDQAQGHLRQVVANQPQNVRAKRLLAEVNARLESPQESLADVKGALDQTQDNPELLAMAGRLSLASGDRQQGLTYLAAATKTGGADVQTQLDIANGYLMAGELDRALEVLQAMPADSAASRQRDVLMLATLARKGDAARVIEEAKAILQRSPKDAQVRNLVGGVYAAINRTDLAREQFDAAAKLAPDDATAWINLGRLDLTQGKPDAAEANLKRGLEKDPKNLTATMGLGAVAALRKDTKSAEKYLLQAIADHPDVPEPRAALAQIYMSTGDVAKAKAVADAAAKENPNSAAMANVRGMILLAVQDLPGAVASLERAVQLEPKSPAFAINLARARVFNRDTPGALKTLDSALQAQPDSDSLLSMAASTALQSNQVEKAAGYVERLRKSAPDAPLTNILEGDLAMAQKRYKDALASYRRAGVRGKNSLIVLSEYGAASAAREPNPEAILESWLRDNPADVRVVPVLAERLRAQGASDRAITIYEAALAKQPENVVMLNNVAVLYDITGNPAKAEQMAARAYTNAPKAPAIADTYGWILFKHGKTAEARPLIEAAAKGLPDNAEVQYHLAAVLAKNGNQEEARRLLTKAVAGQMPADQKVEAQKLLQQLSK